MPDYASLNGLISAIELGYFDDENIDVQLTDSPMDRQSFRLWNQDLLM